MKTPRLGPQAEMRKLSLHRSLTWVPTIFPFYQFLTLYLEGTGVFCHKNTGIWQLLNTIIAL